MSYRRDQICTVREWLDSRNLGSLKAEMESMEQDLVEIACSGPILREDGAFSAFCGMNPILFSTRQMERVRNCEEKRYYPTRTRVNVVVVDGNGLRVVFSG